MPQNSHCKWEGSESYLTNMQGIGIPTHPPIPCVSNRPIAWQRSTCNRHTNMHDLKQTQACVRSTRHHHNNTIRPTAHTREHRAQTQDTPTTPTAADDAILQQKTTNRTKNHHHCSNTQHSLHKHTPHHPAVHEQGHWPHAVHRPRRHAAAAAPVVRPSSDMDTSLDTSSGDVDLLTGLTPMMPDCSRGDRLCLR